MRDEYQGPANVYPRQLGAMRHHVLVRDGRRFRARVSDRAVNTERTKENLVGVHPDLQTLWHATRFPIPCQVIDGLRTFEEQKEMHRVGASKTLNSRHLTGHAIDFAVWPAGFDQPVSWKPEDYIPCVKALKQSAKSLGVHCTFGADWRWDYGHVELSWDSYPLESPAKPKTASNSKTIAAATAGVPIVTFFQEIFAGIKSVTGSLLADVDKSTVGLIQAIALIAIVLFIVYERYKRIERDGT